MRSMGWLVDAGEVHVKQSFSWQLKLELMRSSQLLSYIPHVCPSAWALGSRSSWIQHEPTDNSQKGVVLHSHGATIPNGCSLAFWYR